MILSFFRTVLFYLLLIAVIRIMGKRQIGQMEPAEFVVTMLAANLAVIPMQDTGVPLFAGLVPILTVLGIQLILSALSLRSLSFRKLLCGKPVILIRNGKILQENLRRTRITMDELTGHLRENSVMDPRTVQYAILETDGCLSVFPFPGECPPSARDAGISAGVRNLPVTIVSDGRVLEENLAFAGRDRNWLRQVLEARHTDVAGTWLLTLDRDGQIIFYPREDLP